MKRILEEIWTYISFALMVIGIGGLSWEMFKDNGLMERYLGNIWEAEAHDVLLTTMVVGGTLLLTSIFLRGGLVMKGTKHPLGEVMVYALMACGAYFAFKWWVG